MRFHGAYESVWFVDSGETRRPALPASPSRPTKSAKIRAFCGLRFRPVVDISEYDGR